MRHSQDWLPDRGNTMVGRKQQKSSNPPKFLFMTKSTGYKMDKAQHLQYCCAHSYLERAHISISYPKAS